MSSLVILFVVIVAAVVPNVVGNISLQDVDLNKLIDLVQKQQPQRKIDISSSSDSSSSSSSDDSEDDYTRKGRSAENNVKQILSKLANKNKNSRVSSNNNKNRKVSNVQRPHKYAKSNYKQVISQNDNTAQILEQLLNKGLKGVEDKPLSNTGNPKKRLTPNRLLGNPNVGELDDYSKIYVLLNTEAVEKSPHTKDAVNNLISKLFSLSSPSQRDRTKLKQNRYLGFSLKQNANRRRGRESREMYSPSNSGEDKPKRGRASAGHTAIPYIRHRGDNIYERDN
ncbi:uncharacterized protein LOC142973492 [Anticarsia gemmatalis]|uniref:uncharacterized protein LOC142973492 n=1 Tax=Anticarsia gemmatalis TaxID=129554 RepID=UPI003F76F001